MPDEIPDEIPDVVDDIDAEHTCSKHSPEDGDSMVVHLDIDHYTSTKLGDALQLHKRLMHSILPAEWGYSLVASTNLALFKLVLTPTMSADYHFMLTISTDGSWTLCVDRKQANACQCSVLENVPLQLLSVQDVVNFIALLDSCNVCVGNSDERFHDLVVKHDGKFKNHTGTRPMHI